MEDYFGSLVAMARRSAYKASVKFPQPNYVTLKIAEEAGEVVRGAVHYAEGRMEWSEVEGEIVQLLGMLIRFVTEGDEVNGIKPPCAIAQPTPKLDDLVERSKAVLSGALATDPDPTSQRGLEWACEHLLDRIASLTASLAQVTEERDEAEALCAKTIAEAKNGVALMGEFRTKLAAAEADNAKLRDVLFGRGW